MRRIFELGGVARAHYRCFPGCKGELPRGLALVAHVHCLPSAARILFPWLRSAGLSPDRMLVISKPYSTIPRTLDALRRQGLTLVAEPAPSRFPNYDALSDQLLDAGLEKARARFGGSNRLLLLDDGGKLVERWSGNFRDIAAHTVSIQQTSSGVRLDSRATWNIPYVNIARSVAKTLFEAPAIAGGIVRKLDSLGECRAGTVVGIVGLGAIGTRLAEYLTRRKLHVLAFDTRKIDEEVDGVTIVGSVAELLAEADLVIGCTGKNWMSEADLGPLFRRPHVLASASSRDIEFRTLLDAECAGRRGAGFDTIEICPPGGKVQRVLNGGYPVNFDRRREWETKREMVLTRLLLFAGVLQAVRARPVGRTEQLTLDPCMQQDAVREWLRLNRQKPGDFEVSEAAFDDVNWWRRKPDGIIARLGTSSPRRFAELGRIQPVRRLLNAVRR